LHKAKGSNSCERPAGGLSAPPGAPLGAILVDAQVLERGFFHQPALRKRGDALGFGRNEKAPLNPLRDPMHHARTGAYAGLRRLLFDRDRDLA
jgi:hypothetical protein